MTNSAASTHPSTGYLGSYDSLTEPWKPKSTAGTYPVAWAFDKVHYQVQINEHPSKVAVPSYQFNSDGKTHLRASWATSNRTAPTRVGVPESNAPGSFRIFRLRVRCGTKDWKKKSTLLSPRTSSQFISSFLGDGQFHAEHRDDQLEMRPVKDVAP